MKKKPVKQVRLRICDVKLLEAKPNKLFTEIQRASVRFMHFTQPVKCAYCGCKGRYKWTSLKFFHIAEIFEMKVGGKVMDRGPFGKNRTGRELFPPLTPVCQKHIMAPNKPERM